MPERADAVDRAHRIVMQFGWNATSYQILNPGINFWFSQRATAVVGYTPRNGVLLVAGAPVCKWSVLSLVCEEFEAFAWNRGLRVCYVCAEERLRALFASSPGHATVAIGAQPTWDPARWADVIRNRPSLRAQLHRARNKGVAVQAVTAHDAACDPGLRKVMGEWLRSRRLPPLHFLVEPEVLNGPLADRVILSARRDGEALAFLVASPAPARGGYLIELLARSADAPNGTSELLVDAAMGQFAAGGCRYATLGLVALAHAAGEEIGRNPAWLRALMYFARAHAHRFYNFGGIEQFRTKMAPERWETVYAISSERRFSPRTLYAIGAAFAGISPMAAVAIGLARAVSEEVHTLFGPRRKQRISPAAAGQPSGVGRTGSRRRAAAE